MLSQIPLSSLFSTLYFLYPLTLPGSLQGDTPPSPPVPPSRLKLNSPRTLLYNQTWVSIFIKNSTLWFLPVWQPFNKHKSWLTVKSLASNFFALSRWDDSHHWDESRWRQNTQTRWTRCRTWNWTGPCRPSWPAAARWSSSTVLTTSRAVTAACEKAWPSVTPSTLPTPSSVTLSDLTCSRTSRIQLNVDIYTCMMCTQHSSSLVQYLYNKSNWICVFWRISNLIF